MPQLATKTQMVTVSDLARVHGVLVHVTFPGALDGMRRLGLMTAGQLVADADLTEQEARELTRSFRKESVGIKLSDGTLAVLRRQQDAPRNIAEALRGFSVADWLQLLNSRVYLFPRGHGRVRALIDYNTSMGEAQDLIFFNTRRLLRDVAESVEITTVNTAIFPRSASPSRGHETFVPLKDCRPDALRQIQEVTVTRSIPIAPDAVRMVVRHLPGQRTELIEP